MSAVRRRLQRETVLPPRRQPPGPPVTPANSEGVVGRLSLLALANIGALTALLVYFGWRRSETQARALGIVESVLSMTTQEYVLRSVGPVFNLLALIGVSGLLWIGVDDALLRWSEGSPTARRMISRILAGVWPAPLLTVYLAAQWWDSQAYILFPLGIAAALFLVMYRIDLRQRLGGATMPGFALLRGFVGLSAAACLFWSASNYAHVLGEDLAHEFSTTIEKQVRVVVYSSAPLRLTAPGVRTDILGKDKEEFRYRYSGLRLMDRRGGKYFLVSDRWTRAEGVVMVLRDADAMRVDFVKG
ncbi:hypothetical protein QLQ12_13485 [Actinoplanes sp. NEAU-A12]|uniref:DUF5671 domain-containing protein n=1 Tax=Actinoplanes sandaracinus TaxID=3045177 RepID=A0ABT6WIR0_9ACTN|nr:hypothetical protein [Actinoplanes sandaracinus]MDI6099610.1 hypothetical protein [Actinoplanes sandaracinus]